MIIKGKYNTAIVYTDVIDNGAVQQIRDLCDNAAFKDCKLRVMPDVHMGAGCTIGMTMTIKDKVVPNMVGVDIGCGMDVVMISQKEVDFDKLDRVISEKIPSGMNVRRLRHAYADEIDLTELKCYAGIDHRRANHSIGTLGGGNHFIEMDRDDDGNLYLVVHSGSRHLGVEVASYYQDLAYKTMCGNSGRQLQAMIAKMKAQGNRQNIQKAITQAKRNVPTVPRDMAYLQGADMRDYIADMRLTQRFAILNRHAIIDEIVREMDFDVTDSFTTIHNYIDIDNMILRKGAVSAKRGEKLLIPINMRDGSLICTGKGNAEWNKSAPHGAGRLMSRSEAYKRLTMTEYQREMRGIYTTCVNRKTLDESPMAYKSLSDIVDNVKDTVIIKKRIIPVYNYKCSVV